MKKRLYYKDYAKAGIPPGHRPCMICNVVKPFEDFHKLKHAIEGRNTTCKECRRPLSVAHHKTKTTEKKLYDAAKSRATRKHLAFEIELSDIVIPETCPVFGTPMKRPSVDRVDSSKGYVKGNVRVVSWRANTLKNNATLEELKLIYDDAVRIGTK